MFIFLTRLLFVPLYNVALYLFLPHYKVEKKPKTDKPPFFLITGKLEVYQFLVLI
jgi:hypothetical protein